MDSAEAPVSAPHEPAPESSGPADDLLSRLGAHFSRDESEAPSEPEAQPEQKVEAKVEDKPADEPEQKVEAKVDDEDPKVELQRARDKAEMRKLQAETVKLKKEIETFTKRIGEIDALAKQNPVKLVEQLSGLKFHEFMERTARGDFDDRADLPPDVREKLRLVDEWQAERERAANEAKEREARAQAEAQRAAEREADRPRVAAMIDASKHPILATWAGAEDIVLDTAYDMLDRGERPDVAKIIADMEASAAKTFEQKLSNVKTVQALAANPAIKKALIEALGLDKQQPAGPASSAKGTTPATRTPPRAVASLTEVPSRSDSERSEEEERIEKIRALRQFFDGSAL